MTEKARSDPEMQKLVVKIAEKLETKLNMSKPRALLAVKIVADDLIPFVGDYVLKEMQKK